MFIQNVSYKDLQEGNYCQSSNLTLIQIVDPCMIFPEPRWYFDSVYQFEFTDDEDLNHITWAARMKESQAKDILSILYSSLEKQRDVIVQCVSGQSRSGAVVEAGLLIGFDEVHKNRKPNKYMVSIFRNIINSINKYKK